MPCGDKNLIQNYSIPNANIDLQKDFALYVKSCDKLKFEAQKFIKNAQKHTYKKPHWSEEIR